MEEKHPLKQFEFLPTLPELCERNLSDVRDEVGYIFTLYGFALGYLAGCHPAKAWITLGTQLIRQLGEVDEEQWEKLTIAIADKLEERAKGFTDV